MRNFPATISSIFAAGAMGGLVGSLVAWASWAYGLPSLLGVTISSALTPGGLYQKIVWGGIWGVLFLLPFMRGRWFVKGLILSLAPTVIQLFVIYPFKAQKGIMGLDLGTLTPLLVIFHNAAWGWATGIWLNWTGRRA
jgi:hypothetical protein